MTIASLQTDSDSPAMQSRWKLFVAIVALAALASLASVPMEIASLSHVQSEIPWWAPFIAFAFGFIPTVAAVALGIGTFPATALDFPIIRRLINRRPGAGQMTWAITVPSILFASVGFVVVRGFSEWLEPILVPELAEIASKQADENTFTLLQWTLLSFAAGVREELVFRFGLMTFFVWIGIRLFRLPKTHSPLFWTANLFAVIPFALVHLLNAVGLNIPITGGLIAVILLTNGVVGMMCGWLYSRYGLESAIIAHTAYDLLQFVAWPFLHRTTG